jgi:hypothetical protein
MTLLILMWLLMPYNTATGTQTCGELSNKDKASLREFLTSQVANRVSPCLSSAIQSLGNSRDAESVDILIKYLDYIDPSTLPGPNGGANSRPQYPAVSALFQIGKDATPSLLTAIKTEDSESIRRNAINVYLFIYRDELATGIQLLRREVRSTKASKDKFRLSSALRVLNDACAGRTKEEWEKCKIELSKD